MRTADLLAELTSSVTSRRVFDEPVERDGVTIIPAAEVRAGGGIGGRGQGGEGEGNGGMGFKARPVGAYVIKDGNVRWEPAFDLNRAIIGGQVVSILALLVLRFLIKTSRRRKRRK